MDLEAHGAIPCNNVFTKKPHDSHLSSGNRRLLFDELATLAISQERETSDRYESRR